MIYTISIIVLFCLGWRTITDQGMIFYFLRKPFENLHQEIENKKSVYTTMKPSMNEDDKSESKVFIFKLKAKQFFLKPFVLCITCMASFWGISIYYYIHHSLGIETILCIVSASFIQTFIWNLYEKYL